MENNQIQSVQVRCVYKTGGDYSPLYVERLKKAVSKHTTTPVQFVCLTDDPKLQCESIPLLHDWPGWWSKIELFRPDLPKVPCVYFDLDTIITGNIDPLLHAACQHPFVALRGFNQKLAKPKNPNFASGIMAGSFWIFSDVYGIFCTNPETFINYPRENWMHGDQGFIADHIEIEIIPRLQELLPDNFIVGKRIIRDKGMIPPAAKIIAWSGHPRLHTLSYCSGGIYHQLAALWEGCNESI